jgi:hypothetical protein
MSVVFNFIAIGPVEFISEYVHTHSIPIPKLLEALGVSLVSSALLSAITLLSRRNLRIDIGSVVPRVTEQKTQDDALLLASGYGACVSLSDSTFCCTFFGFGLNQKKSADLKI